VTWAFFAQLDKMRRAQGRLLDAAGVRPQETAYRVVHRRPGLALRRYESPADDGTPLVIVPAPIKRPYIWDLAPEVSVVRRCLATGARVFLADWQSAPPEFGLEDYADRLLAECLDAAGGAPAILLGQSLGGLFAAIFAALHRERVRGLVLLASPLRFGADARAFQAMVAGVDARRLPDALPGSSLGSASFNAAPASFGAERWMDAVASLADPAAMRVHALVERWMLDEFALPRRLAAELVLMVREDLFMRGQLEIGGRGALPSRIRAPLLGVVDPRCRVVPPETVLPFFEAVASRDRTVLRYEPDLGVALQHVGPLVSRRAHASLWPRIVRWIAARMR
jgi:polyhydroxyalkanoate synthase subunit PhaC